MFQNRKYLTPFVFLFTCFTCLVIFIGQLDIQPGYTQTTKVLKSSPDTVVWGYFSADVTPVLTVASGDVVRIDTVSLAGVPPGAEPVAFFEQHGFAEKDVLPEMTSVQFEEEKIPNMGPHVITGPIYIEGAEPGDMLEVRVLDIELRTPYGTNLTRPGFGVLPDLLPEPTMRVIPFDDDKTTALFAEGINVPLDPFMGIMAVAPPKEEGMVSSVPPAKWGGNIDLKELRKGSTLYLPVLAKGALFSTGDGHAAQGDGEVNLTAVEVSSTPTFQFILHKGAGTDMTGPFVETPTHYIPMGLHTDLDEALKLAVHETIDFLGREKGLNVEDAYSLSSIGVDYEVAEAVDRTLIIHAMVPKSLFDTNRPYWADNL
ncbi:acetamidase/formamidase family protein [Nodosilinea sp. E11]|uniref:acetamidase/formamidase family protein n=1 Tax=Nodosilinea sp. E11 TaxID=3037479 RepID=UPI0029345F22|nr:acetamidase/formamidase family protein [Nodosilinea sp. E11]WOD37142.1 acetamidase/formamidase family protein [Nodosilinea sp. E11]